MLWRWQFVAPCAAHYFEQELLGHNWNKFRFVTRSSAVCDITRDVTRGLPNLLLTSFALICGNFCGKKVRFVAERPLEAEHGGNLSVKFVTEWWHEPQLWIVGKMLPRLCLLAIFTGIKNTMCNLTIPVLIFFFKYNLTSIVQNISQIQGDYFFQKILLQAVHGPPIWVS